ncbi:hypothetical protein FZ032_00710 [Listeria monocytogenes]|uniref:Uncharacterized protein n=1 Tax=Listeria monocytogenes TaxID=1639 RepID=A0A5Y9DIU8_LISMN|nr:hypothetical protein [Listeria monocytogenes]ECQ6721961.1 hypothetical protein [Listeria monocytogenes]TYU57848.1 hypothetical protein FZ032_00710 [Listeria monocytogenes]
MKKSYFMRTFYINSLLLMISVLLLVIRIPIKLIETFLQVERNSSLIQYIHFVYKYLAVVLKVLDGVSAVVLLLLILLVLPELISRIAKDSLVNWGKSFWVTYRLRRFLIRQTENERESETTIEQHNKAIRSSMLDIRSDSIVFMIKLPNDFQAQKSISDTKEILREEIASRFPYYIFSNLERFKHCLKLEGTNFK